MPVPTPSGRGLFGSGHRSRAPYASPDSCRDGSPVTSHNLRPRALPVPLLPLGFSVQLPTSGLEPPRRHRPRLTDHRSQFSYHQPHLFFACAPQPPDSRFSPLLGAVGATASIDGIVVAAAPRRGGGAFANNRRNAMRAIIEIDNQKGGVGKTTTAINLAAAIAQRGKKTLLIDLDPQANTTIAFFEQDEIQTTMFDVLGDHRAEMAAIIKPSKDPLLFVAPGRLALAKLEQQLAGQFDAPFKLKDALAPLLKGYDYVLIDTPPALGILTVNAMVTSTHLVVPIQAAYFAIEGTDDLLETYERIRARPNPALKVLGVLITLFDKRTNISRDTHEQIRSVFGAVLFKTRIGKNVRLEESPAYKETIMTYAPKSPGALEYRKLALEVIQRVEEDRIARHTEDAA